MDRPLRPEVESIDENEFGVGGQVAAGNQVGSSAGFARRTHALIWSREASV